MQNYLSKNYILAGSRYARIKWNNKQGNDIERKVSIFQIVKNIRNVDKVKNLRIGDDFYSANVEPEADAKAETVEIHELAELRERFTQCTDEQLRKAKRSAFPGTKIIRISKNI